MTTPSTKWTASAVAAAIVTLAAFIADLAFGVDLQLDPGVVAGGVSAVVLVAQYFRRETRPAPSAVDAVAGTYVARIAQLEGEVRSLREG